MAINKPFCTASSLICLLNLHTMPDTWTKQKVKDPCWEKQGAGNMWLAN